MGSRMTRLTILGERMTMRKTKVSGGRTRMGSKMTRLTILDERMTMRKTNVSGGG